MYQWKKGIAQWKVGNTLYISVPFTWLVAEAERIANNFKGKAIIGGPGLMRPTECEGFEPILWHNPAATFTTRGCVNHCQFCAPQGGLFAIGLASEHRIIGVAIVGRPVARMLDNGYTAEVTRLCVLNDH